MEFSLDNIESAVVEADGLPRVQWDVVERWLATSFSRDEQRCEARLEAVMQWLELLAERLGDDYWINSAPRSILLTSQPRPTGDDLLRFIERALDQIARLLHVSPEASPAPKHILLRLHNIATYYTYISHFYEDGEYGGSGGVCIREGMPHMASPRAPHGGEEQIVAHELTHAVLSDFEAPLWVEEGVAQIVEQQLTSREPLQINHEIARDLRTYWRCHDLADFWTGKSFSAPDAGMQHSYQLAEILVRLILADHKPDFLDFLYDASKADAGEAAARDHFGSSLDQLASIFLG